MPPLDTSRQICPRHLEGKCPLPVHHCVFSHDKNDAPLCSQWVEGACPGGNSCFKRHFYNEKDTKSDKSVTDVNRNSSTVFTSPLVVKVKTMTQSHRREEVDLDSGKRRSWVENRNLELVDLTGQSSPALTKVLSRVRAEKNQDSKNEKAIPMSSPHLDLGHEKETEGSEDGEIREDNSREKSPLGSRFVLNFEDVSNGKNNDRKDKHGHERRYRETGYGRKYSDRENSRSRRSRSRKGRRKSRSRSRSPSPRRRMDPSTIREFDSNRRLRSSVRGESYSNGWMRSRSMRRKRSEGRPTLHRRRSTSHRRRSRTPRKRSCTPRSKRSRTPRKRSRTPRSKRSRTPRRRRSRTPRRRSRTLRTRRSRTPRREKHFDHRSPKRPNLRL